MKNHYVIVLLQNRYLFLFIYLVVRPDQSPLLNMKISGAWDQLPRV